MVTAISGLRYLIFYSGAIDTKPVTLETNKPPLSVTATLLQKFDCVADVAPIGTSK